MLNICKWQIFLPRCPRCLWVRQEMGFRPCLMVRSAPTGKFQPTTFRWGYTTQIMITLFIVKVIRHASYIETFLLPQYPRKVSHLAKYLIPSPAVALFSVVFAFEMISVHYLHQRHILWTWFSKLRQARCTVSHLLSDGAERRPLGISQPDSNLSQDLNNLERRACLSAQHLRKVHIAARTSCEGGDARIPG